MTGTGLTHMASAKNRQAMHGKPEDLTDSMRMYRWGVEGGRTGSMNAVEIIHADGSPSHLAGKTARYPLRKGDVARLITGTGGGWGDPRHRDREAVKTDLRDGLVSPETARDVYGLDEDELAGVGAAT